MNSAPIEFHKIWVEQCAATEELRNNFGVQRALDYPIGGTTVQISCREGILDGPNR